MAPVNADAHCVSAHVNNLFAVIQVHSLAICLFYYIGLRDGALQGWRDVGTCMASCFRRGKAINNDLSSGIRITKVFPWLDSAALIYHSRGVSRHMPDIWILDSALVWDAGKVCDNAKGRLKLICLVFVVNKEKHMT